MTDPIEEISSKEIFSKEEIKSMFDAINGNRAPSDYGPSTGITRRILIYDFKRPNRFSDEHIQALKEVHEKAAISWINMFNQHPQANVQIKFCSVDVINYDEFTRSMPTPTSLIISEGVLNSVPITNTFLIEIDPCTSLLDNSDLEKIAVPLLNEYSVIWNDFFGTKLTFKLKSTSSDPHLVNNDLPSEMGALITMEVKNGDAEGMINVWLSYLFLKPLLPYLAGKNKNNVTPKELYKETNSMNSNNDSKVETGLDNLDVQVVAELGRTVKKLKEIKEIEEGSIMELDNDIYGPISVFVNNVLFAHAETCVVDNNFALRILEIFDEKDSDKEISPKEEV